MVNLEGIFSLRLVISDFYMEKPTLGLDPCYSEFRGKEIKRVPIIRVFGSNGSGQKTCMHIHGVFPYFYIPYDKDDFDSVNKAAYLIATNVDKAINISLGQGSSAAQHVFKIQLVKGIPFYGYHKKEHQLMKIYMFNPRFVRRAANLLQSGAIMGRNFHPFESHVPYILQFMIDYNLYGMSFVHVPQDVVKFRRANDEDAIPYELVKPEQILDTAKAKKVSCCALEVDIGSNFILNRFQLLTKKDNVHSNPGIESIWHDERVRRQQLAASLVDDLDKQKAIPPLEVPPSQDRPNVQPTKTEVFYHSALVAKLASTESSMSGSMLEQTITATQPQPNATINTTAGGGREQRRTFNLSKILANAVYPGECTDADQLVNASFIENHLSKGGSADPFYMTSSDVLQMECSGDDMEPLVMEDDTVYMDDTVVDKQLVLSLTQHVPLNASLRDEDLQLLDVFQQLEEDGRDEHHIDLDSSLAPLSQPHKNLEFTPELLDKETLAAAANQPLSDSDSESDNENGDSHMLDFSMAMDDLDELLSKLTQTQTKKASKPPTDIPQVDGSDDLLRSPVKSSKTTNVFQQGTPPRSPKTPTRSGVSATKQARSPRSPRTPRAAHRYAPLPLVVVKKSSMKNLASDTAATTEPTEPTRRMSLNVPVERKGGTSAMSLRKKLAITELRRKSASALTAHEFFTAATAAEANVTATNAASATAMSTLMAESPKTPRRSLRKTADLDKTHITCALTPPRRKSGRLLKVYNVDGSKEVCPNANAASAKGNEQVPPVKAKEKSRETRKSLRIRSKMKEQADALHSEKATANVVPEETPLDQSQTMIESPQSVDEANDLLSVEKQLLSLQQTLERSFRGSVPAPAATSNNEIQDFVPKEAEPYEDDEEILASDNEGTAEQQQSPGTLRKTPNLKRLRRSFLGTGSRTKKLRRVSNVHGSAETVGQVVNSSKFLHESVQPQTPTTRRSGIQAESLCESDEDDEKMMSFYEQSFVLDSPSVFSDVSSPGCGRGQEHSKSAVQSKTTTPHHHTSRTDVRTETPQLQNSCIITPMDLPPSYAEVLAGCRKFDIPEYEFQQPFYSNPDDLTKDKELGMLVLRIPGNKLNDLAEFQSVLGADHKGLNAWRRKRVAQIGGPLMLNRYRTTQQLRNYCSGPQRIAIESLAKPPAKHEAKVWLKARAMLQHSRQQRDRADNGDDSPIKVRRQKVTMMLNEAGPDGGGDSDGAADDMDYSTCSLSMTPLTPATPLAGRGSQSQRHESLTPLTTGEEQRGRLARRSRVSLQAKLEAAQDVGEDDEQSGEILKVSGGAKSSQSTESSVASSQSVLKEMERSSFMRDLQSGSANARSDISFGLSNATLNNTFGFKVNLENLQQAKADIQCNYLTIVTLELFVPTRHELLPNPEHDEIRCIFYAIEDSVPAESADQPTKRCGYIIVNDASDFVKEGKIHGIDADIQVKVAATEIQAIEELLALCSQWDADIYAGYEIEMASWGYVIERAKYLCLNIAPLLSRVPTQKTRDFIDEDRDQFTDLDIEMKLCGRILLDVWRLMRSEIALTSYTFENVMYHILHKRCPWHSYRALTDWFQSPSSRWIVIEYYLERVRGTLALLDQLDLIGRTSEMAKLIGIQFYEVLSRGSQFRVESMMLRIAKPRNLVPLSPSVQQRAHMRAPEFLPLILEPQSRFFADPLIVLDFQSLYPSMIIAYNYCFSTCLGRVEHLGQSTPFEFGASQLRVSPALLRKLLDRDLVTITPCGVVFVKSSVREGILPRMLTEILDTRLMVKQSMKLHKSNSALQRILHSRQLGLKLMANVTYGYTAANFSGRMPSVEVGDSVVAKGRETLERAIQMVQSNEQWNVRVVYGDTDSLFVLVPGRNREQAFKIGEEIAEAVTNDNPQPVKLKLEKVYQPCILQTKKRYVGYMYETADQQAPVYEAKGIETVRRDGCPAVSKMLEKVLRILFETADVSQVKQYVCRQFTKLLSGKANLQDLIFAKEFRGLNGYKPTACVPALEMTRKWLLADPRRIPRRGERVPFIVINGPPGVPLIRLVRHPHEVLANEGYKINAIYYITKAIIPALNRCLLLIGADVNDWFSALPRKILLTPALSAANELIGQAQVLPGKKSTISQYFSTTNCIVDCGRQTKAGVCSVCDADRLKTVVTLHDKCATLERSTVRTAQICQACCGRIGDIACASLDCPVLYVVEVKRRALKQLPHLRKLLAERQCSS